MFIGTYTQTSQLNLTYSTVIMISVVWCSFYVRLFYFVRLFNYSLMRRCICIYFNFFYLLFLFQKNENKNVYLFYYFGFAFVHRCNHFNNWVRWLLFFFPSFSRCHQYMQTMRWDQEEIVKICASTKIINIIKFIVEPL